ncbi:MAG: hypothetical protein V3T83_14760, partial [Acidobacteriota bacterium]
LLYLLGATIYQVAVQEGYQPDKKNLEHLVDSVHTITSIGKDSSSDSLDVAKLASNLICFGASALGGSIAEKLAKAALEPFKLSSGVSDELVRKREIEPQVQHVINNVNLIIADVETKANRPLLVVVDGLDKLQRYEQAKLIFLDSRALRGPVCRIIYTVPMLIYASPGFGQVEEESVSFLLPNIKLYHKTSEKKYSKGYQLLSEVVSRRLQLVNLQARDLFAPKALNYLIQNSGGILRWLIRLVRDAAINAEVARRDRIEFEDARRAVLDRSKELAFRLSVERIEQLRRIRERKLYSAQDEIHDLLQSLLIVAYWNDDVWFDVHPMIWDKLKP